MSIKGLTFAEGAFHIHYMLGRGNTEDYSPLIDHLLLALGN